MRRIAWLFASLLPAVVPAADLPMTQRLELLERRVNHITDLTLKLDDVRRENRELRGRIEELGYEIEQLKRKQRDIYLDIDERLSAQTGAAPAPMPAGDAAAGPAGAPGPGVASPPAGGAVDRAQIEAEYQAAYELLSPQQKRYAEAAAAFATFLQKYPDDELAPNAQYWLGEAYYVSQRNADALAAFEVVVDRYPSSTKAPGALFKIGRLHQAAGRGDVARASFERVLADYPDSPAAGLARERLKQSGR